MKQAILITAYKNVDQLLDIINFFPDSFEFYIHIDKKSRLDINPLMGINGKKIFITQQYSINWGGQNHLKAILLLSEEALKNKSLVFFHLITGEDFPIKSVDYFLTKLDITKDYLEFFPMPTERWSGNGGMERISYYNLFDFFNAKNKYGMLIIRMIAKIQKVLNLKRIYPKEFPRLYGGSTYWSLTRNTLEYVVHYTQNNHNFLPRFKFTCCAEEMYFQTVILNSKASAEIVNDNLRYIDWTTPGKKSYPAYLDLNDLEKIISSDKLFARKLHSTESKELKHILSSTFS